VAEDAGDAARRDLPIAQVQVGAAHRTRLDLDQLPAWRGLGVGPLTDLVRLTGLDEVGRTHRLQSDAPTRWCPQEACGHQARPSQFRQRR